MTQVVGWDTFHLGEVIIDAQSGFATGERDRNGVIQLRMNNVTTDGTLDWSNFIRVPVSSKVIDKYSLQIEDVLFNSTNSPELVGKSTLFKNIREPVVFSNHFIRLRTDINRLDPSFLAKWLLYQWQRRVFEILSTQWVNQAAVRKEDLLSLKIQLPPLPEQRRIAAILEKTDRLRRLHRYALEVGETLLQSVFLEMFGDPATNPMNWPIESVGKVIESIRYGTGSPPEFQHNGIPFIRATNIKKGTVQPDEMVFISERDAKKIANCKVRAGDLILVRSGANTGDCALIPPAYHSGYAAYDLIIEVDQPYNFYLNHLINSPFGKAVIGPLSRRAGQPHLNAEQVKGLEFPFPSVDLIEKFANVGKRVELLNRQNKEAIRQANNLFQTLLHRAFNDQL